MAKSGCNYQSCAELPSVHPPVLELAAVAPHGFSIVILAGRVAGFEHALLFDANYYCLDEKKSGFSLKSIHIIIIKKCESYCKTIVFTARY
jgi:hypothetical protein